MSKVKTIKDIENQISVALAKEGFRGVEVGMRGEKGGRTLWTLIGSLDVVAKASKWLESKGLMVLEEQVAFDEEIGEAFAYLQSAT